MGTDTVLSVYKTDLASRPWFYLWNAAVEPLVSGALPIGAHAPPPPPPPLPNNGQCSSSSSSSTAAPVQPPPPGEASQQRRPPKRDAQGGFSQQGGGYQGCDYSQEGYGDPVAKAVYDNLEGKLPLKRKKDIKCDICDIMLTSDVHANTHFMGAKHKKRTIMMENYGVNRKLLFRWLSVNR